MAMKLLEGHTARLYVAGSGEYRERPVYVDEDNRVYAQIGLSTFVSLYINGGTSAKGIRLSALTSDPSAKMACVGGKLGRYVAVEGRVIVPPKAKKLNGSKEKHATA